MKNKSTLLFVIILLIIVFMTGYNYYKRPFYTELNEQELAQQLAQQPSDPTATPTPDLKKEYFDLMSAEDKINQMIMFPIDINSSVKDSITIEEQEWITQNKPGFILLFGKKVDKDLAEDTVSKSIELFKEDYPAPIIAVDHEGGTVQRLSGDGFTIVPSWKEMCEMSEISTEEEAESNFEKVDNIKIQERNDIFQKSAQELSEVGINVVFAPVIDISIKNSALGSRVCGDPAEIEDTANEYINTFSQKGIMSVLKHFPGIGSTTKDLHSSHDEVVLSSQDTDIFKVLLDKYPNIGLMISHVTIKDVINVPCSLSSECIGKIPIQYPDALIYTDALEMKSAGYIRDSKELKALPKVVVEAVYAGNNVLVFGEGVSVEDFTKIQKALYSEYDNSSEFRNMVDASAEKIISLKKI